MCMMKTTNKEMFAIVMEMVQLADVPQAEIDMAVAFLQDRSDLLSKKGEGKKLTKTQQENESIKATLEIVFAAEGMLSISEIQKLPTYGDYSNQKLSALLNQMVKAGTISKSIGADHKTIFGIEKPKTKNENPKMENENCPMGDSRVEDIERAFELAELYQALLDGDITQEDYDTLVA